MKTIFDKVPLLINAGETISLSLQEPFCPKNALFLLVHHAIGQFLTLTLQNESGDTVSETFTLHSFPAILVFSQGAGHHNGDKTYNQVSFTSFHAFEGRLTYRIKNPERVMATYRNA
ncbi:hypothetical protein HRG84_23760 [Flavisolibacter sp. BT320]|nr:hypothetical protein [Flavisolibacter longurius]